MEERKKIKLFSDGSCLSNPNGPGGYGVIIQTMGKDNTIVSMEEFAGRFDSTTNNRMELMGVIVGLESLKEPCDIIITTDSSYVVNAFVKGWLANWEENNWKNSTGQPVKNPDLWKRLSTLTKNHTVEFRWIKGHAGHKENERCDYLAFSMASNISLIKNEKGLYEVAKNENE